MNLLKIVLLFCFVAVSAVACNHNTQIVMEPRPITKNHFGYVFIGTTVTSSTYHWKNIGNTTINTSALIATPLGGVFAYTPGFIGETIQSGNNTMGHNFTFSPVAEGEVTGSANLGIQEIQFNVTPVELVGIGIAQKSSGDISIGGGDIINAGEVLDFGDVLVPGGTPVVKEFNLRNPLGNNPITLQASWFSGNGFTIISPTTGITVAPGGSVTIKIQFAPTAVGDYNDGVWFIDRTHFLPVNFAGTAVKGRGVAGG